MKVLLVGGNGFIGTAMQENAPSDAEVSVFSRTAGGEDVLSKEYTHIVNLVTGCAPHENISITWQLQQKAQRSGARLLVASSGAAWERNEYGALCALKEEMCPGAVIARLYSFIGGQKLTSEHACRQFFDQARRGETVVVTGSGEAVRSYLHVSEAAEMMWDLLLGDQSGIHEIGSCIPIRVVELAHEIADVYGVAVDVHSGWDGNRLVYLPERGVVPRIGLREAVEMEVGK
jgi:nucleoside-diphosphate-sugar epimerase